MKHLVFASFLVAAIIIRGQCSMTEAEKNLYFDMFRNCGISEDIIDGARIGVFPADNEDFKERLLCVLKATGNQAEDGYVNLEAFDGYLRDSIPDNPALREEVKKNCADRKATPQETVFNYAKCLSGYWAKMGLDMK